MVDVVVKKDGRLQGDAIPSIGIVKDGGFGAEEFGDGADEEVELKAALARGIDVVIVDTAGRLHVKTNLIEELKKVLRVIGRQIDGAPHEVLLVVDGTAGQNIVNQARVFCEALPVSGLVLTKLDGTAKGGAVLAVRTELGVPIRYVGLGEAPEVEPEGGEPRPVQQVPLLRRRARVP